MIPQLLGDLRRAHLPKRYTARKYRIPFHAKNQANLYMVCYYLCRKHEATYPELKKAGVVAA